MSITAYTGPLVVFGRGRSQAGLAGDYNSNSGPSMGELCWGMMDVRQQFAYQPGQSDLYNFSSKFYGWVGSGEITMLDQTPSTAATNNIVNAAAPVSGTPLTLVSSSGAGITVGASVVNALTGQLVTGLLAIDGAAGAVGFGTAGEVNVWDPTKALSRTLILTNNGNDTGGTYLLSGFDIYGFPMTQLLTGPSTGTVSTTKAFKYLQSITPGGTIASTSVSVGTNDVFGLPLLANLWAYVSMYWNNVLLTTATTFTAAVTTSPATNVTGDVRGTVGVPSASDGTKKMQLFWKAGIANLASNVNGVGVVGVQQV